MSYTNVWSDTIPLDSELADQLCANIRQLRLDLDQRLTTGVFVNMTDDPINIQPDLLGAGTGLVKIIPGYAFIDSNSTSGLPVNTVVFGTNGIVPCSVPNGLIAPLTLPVGCEVTQIQWLVDIHTSTTVVMDWYSMLFQATPGAPTQQSSTTASVSTGVNVWTSSGLSYTLLDTEYYYLTVGPTGSGSCNFYACAVTFNRPSSANAT